MEPQTRATGPNIPTDADTLLLAYLRDHGGACPACGYDVRGADRPVCPECGTELRLTVGRVEHPPWVWIAMLMAVCFAAGDGAYQVLWIASLPLDPDWSWITPLDLVLPVINVAFLMVVLPLVLALRGRFLKLDLAAQVVVALLVGAGAVLPTLLIYIWQMFVLPFL